MLRYLLLSVFVLGLSWSVPAWSCSLAELQDYSVNPELAATDTQAPGVASLDSVRVSRGVGPMQEGCGESATSCDDLGLVNIKLVPPEDDQSPSDNLGYMITLKEGSLPGGVELPSGPVLADANSVLYLAWVDGAQDKQEPIGFTLEIFAMDLAGNVGEPLEVRVSDPGSSDGCSAAPGRVGSWLPLVALLGALVALRRRRAQ